MALFKVYRGDSSALPGGKNPTDKTKLHDGYAYFCTDSGEFFIDVDFGGTIGIKRVQVNAEYATGLKDGSTTVEIDDIVLTTDIIDIDHGGTGASTKAAARTNLEVYSKGEVDTEIGKVTEKAYEATLSVGNWTKQGEQYIYNYANANLKCGKGGNVPPLITYTSNLDEYSKIDEATCTVGTGIKFVTSKQPTKDIGIIVIDQG